MVKFMMKLVNDFRLFATADFRTVIWTLLMIVQYVTHFLLLTFQEKA